MRCKAEKKQHTHTKADKLADHRCQRRAAHTPAQHKDEYRVQSDVDRNGNYPDEQAIQHFAFGADDRRKAGGKHIAREQDRKVLFCIRQELSRNAHHLKQWIEQRKAKDGDENRGAVKGEHCIQRDFARLLLFALAQLSGDDRCRAAA